MSGKVLVRAAVAAVLVAASALALWSTIRSPEPHEWSEGERHTLRSLWLGSLPDLPPDLSNAVADDPRAAELGRRLYFDTRFSANGEVACATCHQPAKMFTDGLRLAKAIGTTRRHAPTIVGVSHSPWFFWDGRKDSQWAQALAPMEEPNEHGGTRALYAHLVAREYRDEYETLFGALPELSDGKRFPASAGPKGPEDARAAWDGMTPEDRDAVNRVYANIGKAIAAYERLIMPGPSRFDGYVESLLADEVDEDALSADELAGLRLFIGEANCTQCHNGPLFTNNGFHNIGLPPVEGQRFDKGRVDGARQALADTFNCRSRYSDAAEDDCGELRFIKRDGLELFGALKVPTLRNVAETAPYMHTGQLATLSDVLAHYNAPPLPVAGHSDLVPLMLSERKLGRLEAFLRSLSGGVSTPPELLEPPSY